MWQEDVFKRYLEVEARDEVLCPAVEENMVTSGSQEPDLVFFQGCGLVFANSGWFGGSEHWLLLPSIQVRIPA